MSQVSIAVSAFAAILAGILWRPGVGLLDSRRPRWLRIATPMATAAALALVMAGLFSGVAAAIAVGAWAAGCAWLVLIDFAERRLPWRLAIGTAAVLIALFGVQAMAEGSAGGWLRAVIAAVTVTGLLFALAWWSGGRLGLGDVALGIPIAVLLGWLGWGFVWRGIAMGFVVGGAWALVALARRQGRRAEFPFGPCMVAGAVLGAWLNVAS